MGRIWGFVENEGEETRASGRASQGRGNSHLTEHGAVAAAALVSRLSLYLIIYCLMLTVITACSLYFIRTE